MPEQEVRKASPQSTPSIHGVFSEFISENLFSEDPKKILTGLNMLHSLAHGEEWHFNFSLGVNEGSVVILTPFADVSQGITKIANGEPTLEHLRPFKGRVEDLLAQFAHENMDDINSRRSIANHLMSHL